MKKILIADDDIVIRSLIQRTLLKHNPKYQIRGSTSVVDTRDACESFQPDLLIIDDLHGGGVALGDRLHRSGKKVIITAARVVSQAGTPQIQKGSKRFASSLLAKTLELLGE